jgi:hypothetical protein
MAVEKQYPARFFLGGGQRVRGRTGLLSCRARRTQRGHGERCQKQSS